MTTGTKWVLGCAIAAVAAFVAVVVLSVLAFLFIFGGRGTTHQPKPGEANGLPAEERTMSTLERSREKINGVPTTNRIVLISSDEQAYTVYMRIPASKIEEQTISSSGLAKAERVDWESFEKHKERYVHSRIVKNDYPQHRVVDGLMALLARNEGLPIGLTWNGGIAVTNNDYEHARRMFRQYQNDASDYERTRNRDPKADPVHPRAHFEPLLHDPYLSGAVAASE
ncbi:MAG: hypothetical protein JXO72_07420 [Vicinamibacteria bacterium]|nr:hypothetical protein [Vicinamibacteria bacterium]